MGETFQVQQRTLDKHTFPWFKPISELPWEAGICEIRGAALKAADLCVSKCNTFGLWRIHFVTLCWRKLYYFQDLRGVRVNEQR